MYAGKKILIVDDSQAERDVVRNIVSGMGLEIFPLAMQTDDAGKTISPQDTTQGTISMDIVTHVKPLGDLAFLRKKP